MRKILCLEEIFIHFLCSVDWGVPPAIVYPAACSSSVFTFEKATPPTNHISAVNLVFAGLLSGVGHTAIDRIANLWNMSSISPYQWIKTLDYIKPIVQQAARKSILKAAGEEMAKHGHFHVMEDACWNQRGFSSSMGCCSFVGFFLHKVVGINIMINKGKLKNFDGNAKSMEGEGTREICKIIMENNMVVELFLHDGDSSAYNAILEFFPDCTELRCANHASKNVGKWARKQFGNAWGTRIQAAFKYACTTAKANSSTFISAWKIP